MKNGVNVAGVSEMMHEIRGNAVEGVFAYDAEAQWTGGDTLNAFVNSALIGSVKSARGFQWRMTLGESAPVSETCTKEMLFTPEELALTGLGSCAMLTMVKGATTCGRNIQSLRFLVKGKHYPADKNKAATLSDFDYRVEFDADSEEDNMLFSEVLKKLSHHSPNHRTIVERNVISVKEADITIDKLGEMAALTKSKDLQVEMNWEYGFQLKVNYDSVRYTRVDQPKQAGGIDRGANPQEILMSAFASCLTRTFIKLMGDSNLPLNGVTVRTTGHVDMRGMLGIAPSIPSKLQDISASFDVDTSVSKNEINQIIEQSIQQSPVSRLLIEPQSVNLHLHRHSAQIIQFVSKG
ncbi:MAG: OsmC family protein [Cellvibrionaceae bacterium]